MDISIFLARVMGLYFIIVSLAFILNRQYFLLLMNSLLQNTELLFVLGINVLLIGILLVVGHNLWVNDWRVVITIIAWLIFIKGLSYIFMTQVIMALSKSILEFPAIYFVSAIVNFLIGSYLCYFGFFA